ncbi:DUF1192 family protein [Novosphingobium flavum]|uniref:DUF1192 family protein n=1 Tax=Novosphingobium flavum TaxID=1778672 RepID=A0A7X1KKG2_9SPHN|nr:DUF1192 family protein [Novosphingobium flavum]
MDDEPPLRRGDAANQLSRESLDSYSQEELAERVILLEAEIARVKAHGQKAAAHRLAAEAFFKPPSDTARS